MAYEGILNNNFLLFSIPIPIDTSRTIQWKTSLSTIIVCTCSKIMPKDERGAPKDRIGI